MQRKIIAIYFTIFVTLLVVMSLSRHTNDKMRGQSVAIFAPFWEKILSLKYFFFHPYQPSPFTHLSIEEEKQRLQLENQLLEIEVAYLQEQIQEKLLMTSQIEQIASHMPEEAKMMAADYEKAMQNTFKITQRRMHALPARVIFRSFDTWNSFLWINIGESINRDMQSVAIAKNSPVVIGKSIVGIIDYVGEHQARVRLISDSRLTPSVRATRGGEQDFLLSEKIEGLLHQMHDKKNLPISSEEQTKLFRLLLHLQQNLQPFKKTWYLAKGKLLGSMYSAKLGQSVYLRGVGFNYDFSDEEGGNRDLRSGKINQSQEEVTPILKVNDILITTGMDGLFPPGFEVAVVTRVGLLKEGDYFYDLEARPIVNSLEELTLVFVLPPMTSEPIKQD